MKYFQDMYRFGTSAVFSLGCTLFVWPVEGARVSQLNVELLTLNCWKYADDKQALRAEGETMMRFKRGNKKLQWKSNRKLRNIFWLKPAAPLIEKATSQNYTLHTLVCSTGPQ